jgi:hypothetical protein
VAEAPLPPTSDRRPNTSEPATFVSLTDEDLLRMNDTQLIEFADRMLGIVIPFGTKRTTILTKIINASIVVRDGR